MKKFYTSLIYCEYFRIFIFFSKFVSSKYVRFPFQISNFPLKRKFSLKPQSGGAYSVISPIRVANEALVSVNYVWKNGNTYRSKRVYLLLISYDVN